MHEKTSFNSIRIASSNLEMTFRLLHHLPNNSMVIEGVLFQICPRLYSLVDCMLTLRKIKLSTYHS